MPIDSRLRDDFQKDADEIIQHLQILVDFVKNHQFDPDDGLGLGPIPLHVIYFACIPHQAKVTPGIYLEALKSVANRLSKLTNDFRDRFRLENSNSGLA